MRRVVPFGVAVAVVCTAGTVTLVRPAAAEEGVSQPATETVDEARAQERKLAVAHAASQIRTIKRYRKQTWAWQKLMRTRLTPLSHEGPVLAPPPPPLRPRSPAPQAPGLFQSAARRWPAQLRPWCFPLR